MKVDSAESTISFDQFSGACDKKSLTQRGFLEWSFKVFGGKKNLSLREQKELFQSDLERLFWNGVLPSYAVRAVTHVAESAKQSFAGRPAKEPYRRRSYANAHW